MYRRLPHLDAAGTDFWFGDNLFEEVPGLLHAGQTRLPELLATPEDKEMLLMHRLIVSEAVSRLAREQPALRPAIVEFMRHYLRHIIAHATQATQLFPQDPGAYSYELANYLGGLLADVQDAGLRELEPEIRELHRLGLVDESIGGDETDIDFNKSQPLQSSPDIFTRYQELRDDLDDYSPFHPDAAAIAQRRAEEEAHYAQRQAEYYTARSPHSPAR